MQVTLQIILPNPQHLGVNDLFGHRWMRSCRGSRTEIALTNVESRKRADVTPLIIANMKQ